MSGLPKIIIDDTTMQYLQKKYAERGRLIPENYMVELENYCKKIDIYPYDIRFTKLKNEPLELLSGEAVQKEHCILISPAWLVDLLIENRENKEIAFDITLGHELTHLDGDLWKKRSFLNLKFQAWLIPWDFVDGFAKYSCPFSHFHQYFLPLRNVMFSGLMG